MPGRTSGARLLQQSHTSSLAPWRSHILWTTGDTAVTESVMPSMHEPARSHVVRSSTLSLSNPPLGLPRDGISGKRWFRFKICSSGCVPSYATYRMDSLARLSAENQPNPYVHRNQNRSSVSRCMKGGLRLERRRGSQICPALGRSPSAMFRPPLAYACNASAPCCLSGSVWVFATCGRDRQRRRRRRGQDALAKRPVMPHLCSV